MNEDFKRNIGLFMTDYPKAEILTDFRRHQDAWWGLFFKDGKTGEALKNETVGLIRSTEATEATDDEFERQSAATLFDGPEHFLFPNSVYGWNEAIRREMRSAKADPGMIIMGVIEESAVIAGDDFFQIIDHDAVAWTYSHGEDRNLPLALAAMRTALERRNVQVELTEYGAKKLERMNGGES